jgi:hypothetical protein
VIWLSWRQQRTETILVAALLAALAAVLIPNGVHMAAAYDDAHLSSCVVQHPRACVEAIASFNARFDGLRGVFVWFNFVPGLIGVLFAAPFALDLEHGTYRLAWTQSATRRRWLVAKLGTAVVCALAATALAVVLVSWWRTPLDTLNGRLDVAVFDFEGIVPYAYTLFAFGLALSIGSVTRRVVPAILTSLVAYAAVRIFVQDWLRQRFMHPLSATWSATERGEDLRRAWVLLERPSDKAGHVLPGNGIPFLRGCAPTGPSNDTFTCLAHHGVYRHVVWQPADRFWAFQWIEFGIFSTLAVALLIFAVAWVRRLH